MGGESGGKDRRMRGEGVLLIYYAKSFVCVYVQVCTCVCVYLMCMCLEALS